MAISKSFIEQIDPPRPLRETRPTMHDSPSEHPEEPGLPDEFHDPAAVIERHPAHCPIF
jgi:hypothetical protein